MSDELQKYRSETGTLTDAVLFASKGAIHPRFIPPSIFNNSAALARVMRPELEFPGAGEKLNPLRITEISEIAIAWVDKKLVYYIAVPLLDKARFSLYRATPLPIRQTHASVPDVFTYIWPEHEFTAINKELNTYMPILPADIRRCKKFEALFVCAHNEPVRELNDHQTCETHLITQEQTPNPEECSIRLAKLKETYWSKLYAPNRWAFSTVEDETIFIRCRGEPHKTVTLSGGGVISLAPGCSGDTKDARLVAPETIDQESELVTFERAKLDIREVIKSLMSNSTDAEDAAREVLASDAIGTVQTHGNAKANALEEGTPLRDIIQKARALSEAHDTREEIRSFKWLTLVTVGLIIIAVTGGFAAWKCLLREGAPLLMVIRLLTGTNRHNNGAASTGGNNHPILQPIVLVHQGQIDNQPTVVQSQIQRAIQRELAKQQSN